MPATKRTLPMIPWVPRRSTGYEDVLTWATEVCIVWTRQAQAATQAEWRRSGTG